MTITILGSWVTGSAEGFMTSSCRIMSSVALSAQNEALSDCKQSGVSLRFSHSFQRHVVYDSNQSVLGSYEFLDRALEDYSDAILITQGTQTRINETDDVYMGCFAGSGVDEQFVYRELTNRTSEDHSSRIKVAYDALMTLSKLAAELPVAQHAVARYLAENSGKLRFIDHTPETIKTNYKRITKLLKNTLEIDASDIRQKILAVFPQICLYDTKEIADRLKFFIAPPPPAALMRAKAQDWPLLASQGYGAGLSMKQLRTALRAVPHMMAMYYEDAVLKPKIGYYLHILQAPFQLANVATIELKNYLDGATFSDIAHITFLYKLGISWDQLRIILAAFPTLVVCDTQPSAEMLNKGVVRRDIAHQKLHYFQSRLQLRPTHVKSMLIVSPLCLTFTSYILVSIPYLPLHKKTHTRLGSYSAAAKLKPTLDALQKRLKLTSEELRTVMLRQPSLVGMTTSQDKGFNQRIDFFLNDIEMNVRDLRRSVIRHPSLLQYSVDASLRPKFTFLREEIFVPANKLAKVVITTPGILGLSLEENLRPSSRSFMGYLEITPEEFGAIVGTAPQILASSWKSNLEPKLRYLINRLDLDTPKLKNIVKAAPRLLLYNIERSIEPKIVMIEELLRGSGSSYSIAQVVLRTPSMLVTTNDSLRKRLDLAKTKSLDSGSDAYTAMLPRRSSPHADLEFLPANRRLLTTDDSFVQPLQLIIPNDAGSSCLISEIANSKYVLERGYAPGFVPIIVYVAGRVYPRDSLSIVRGSYRKGGVALFFPQVAYGSPQFTLKFAQIARACFRQLLPETEFEFFGSEGAASVGFPGLWPSRTRTELAACHSALRAVLLLLVQEAGVNASAKYERFQVDIYTASEAVWRLLRNETRLLEWGEYESMKSFRETAAGSKSPNNVDLLFPLCKTVSRMMGYRSVIDQNGNSIRLGEEVKIRFLHASDGNTDDESIRALGALARVAARWYYEKDNTPVR